MEKDKAYKTLCWKCANACNAHKCKWAKACYYLSGLRTLTKEESLKYMPDGVILDDDKNVLQCPNFVKDDLIYSIEDKAEKENLTIKQFQYKNYKIKKLFIELFEINNEEFDKYFDFEQIEYYFNRIFANYSQTKINIINDYFNSVTHLPQKYNKGKFEIKNIIFDFLNEFKKQVLNDYDNNKLEDHDKLIEQWHEKNKIKLKPKINNSFGVYTRSK